MGHTEFVARLIGDELGKDRVSSAGGTEGVDVDGVARAADVAGTNGRYGATQRVAGDDKRVGWIGCLGRFDAGQDGLFNLLPGGHKSGVDEAAEGEAARDLGKEKAVTVSGHRYGRGYQLGVLGDPVAD